jgi:NADPH-dependent ferric siderophore reductase
VASATVPAKLSLGIYQCRVVHVERLNPHFARVVLGGEDLRTFHSIGPDQFVYVFVPRPGEDDPRVEHDFSWDSWRSLPEHERQVGRYFTVRRHDAERHEITIDFALHGEGPLTTWAANRAAPGERTTLWGPRKGFDPPSGTSRFVLFADETGLPALAAIVESLPPNARVTAVVELPDQTALHAIDSKAEVGWTWVFRGEHGAGQTNRLVEAVQAQAPSTEPYYAWGGGEFRAMNSLRKHFRALGCGPADMSIIAYWRHPSHAEDEGETS